jgi:hypothetical protein
MSVDVNGWNWLRGYDGRIGLLHLGHGCDGALQWHMSERACGRVFFPLASIVRTPGMNASNNLLLYTSNIINLTAEVSPMLASAMTSYQ